MLRRVVGISLLTLVPGVVGGAETYARELVRALSRVGQLEYRVFLPTIAEDAGDGLPSSLVTAYRAGWTMPKRLIAMSMAGARPGPIRRQLRLESLDAIHFPLSVMLPAVDHPPAATTVLDIQHEFLPQNFSKAELAYRRLVYGWTVRRSQIVITISEHARQTLIDRLHLPPEKVRAIYFGVDQRRFSPDGRPREQFLLYPANRWPHKNHERLFKAFAAVRTRRPGLRLVLTGAFHENKPVPAGVEVLGRIPADDLLRLYRTAAAVVFPSLYEGFGQPPLEAMACGCPVAASNAGPLPEILGDAVAAFDPSSVEEITAAIERVLDQPAPLVERGRVRAALFTWEECARRHDEVYRELLASG